MATLFAHLATQFAPSSENIAIEALGFILSRSQAARRAFTRLAETGGLSLPTDLTFDTQAVADDAARPDIEGHGPDLRRYVVCECKFWAGLTINQPITYAQRLPVDVEGALMFVVPSARFASLWRELTRRLVDGGYEVSPRRETLPELWVARFGAGHSFLLVSWRAVLVAIQREMEAEHETERLEDVRQLAGLCDRMDKEAFLPFRSEELTDTQMASRYHQLGQIVNDVADALLLHEGFDRRGLTPGGSLGFYGRYLRYHDTVFNLTFDSIMWSSHHHSPLWVRFDNNAPPGVLDALRRGKFASTAHPIAIDQTRRVFVPIFIPPGSERPDITASLVEQTLAILGTLRAIVAPPSPDIPPLVMP